MIIHSHRHLWSLFERYASARTQAAAGGVMGIEGDAPPPLDVVARASSIREDMAAAGVDHTVIFLGDYGLQLGEPPLGIDAENRIGSDLARSDPEHLSAFFGIDPRRPDAAARFARAIADDGVRGLKLHPCAGFYPNDPACWPLYGLAGEAGIPVAVHTGPMAAPLVSHFADPAYVDEGAARFPRTTFILLHAGQAAWFPTALNMARWKPNLFLDVALWQLDFRHVPEWFFRRIGEIKKTIGLDRVLFGSDLPGPANVMGLAEWVEVFRQLPDHAEEIGVDVSDVDVHAILGGTAARLLALEERS